MGMKKEKNREFVHMGFTSPPPFQLLKKISSILTPSPGYRCVSSRKHCIASFSFGFLKLGHIFKNT